MTIKIQSPATQSNPLAQEESKNLTGKQGVTPETKQSGTEQESVLLSSQSQRIKTLVEAMAKEPPMDMERVNQVRQKLENGTLEILGQSGDSKSSLDRIVSRIIEIDSALESSGSQDT